MSYKYMIHNSIYEVIKLSYKQKRLFNIWDYKPMFYKPMRHNPIYGNKKKIFLINQWSTAQYMRF